MTQRHPSFTSQSPRHRDRGTSRLVELRLGRPVVVGMAITVIVLCLISLSLGIISSGLHLQFRGLASLQGYFDLDHESNVPTWFSSMLLITCAALAWTAGDDAVRHGWGRRPHWVTLAIIFAYLSLDELAMLHERANIIGDIFDTSGIFEWAWVLLAIPLLLVFALAYIPFLWTLPRSTRNGFIIAGLVYVGGAIGMEMVGAELFTIGGLDSIAYRLSTTIEEGLEMAGVIILIDTLRRHAFNVNNSEQTRADDVRSVYAPSDVASTY